MLKRNKLPKPLGEILVEKGIIQKDQLTTALEQQAEKNEAESAEKTQKRQAIIDLLRSYR